jgi:hypothetical protein
MNRDRYLKLALGAVAAAILVWVARHTYWDTVDVPTPMKGEALSNPYYSVEHFAGALGVHTRRISSLRGLEPGAVILVSRLQDDLLHQPLESLESWVESGGRLIIPADMLWSSTALQKWSGITIEKPKAPSPPAPRGGSRMDLDPDRGCVPMKVRLSGADAGESLRVCGVPSGLSLVADRAPSWSLTDDVRGTQVLRVSVGLGELTVIGPAWILSNQILPRGDNAAVLFYSAALRHADTLLILSPSRAEPLLALLWRLAAPAMLFLGAAMLLLILRNVPRFGPPLPAPQPIRRSLAEQIRAKAHFAWRTRKLGSLRAAVRRSLNEAAQCRIRGYASLDARARADSVAASTGIDAGAIGAALSEDAAGDTNEHRAAITLLEVCRRILVKSDPIPKGPSHAR